MKSFPALVQSLALLAAVAFLPGCMSNAQFESSELTTAGFKAVTATTPAQQAHLKALPQGKISKVPRNGHTYFVYPDASNKTLYVGRQAQYNVFQKNQAASIREDQSIMEDQNAFVGNDAYLGSFSSNGAYLESFSAWGPWEGLSWGY